MLKPLAWILLGLPLATLTLATPARAQNGVAHFTLKSVQANVAWQHDVANGFQFSNYTGGGTVGDFNNDGWQDIFLLSGGDGGQRDRLLINDKDGSFTESSAAWGLTTLHNGRGAMAADFDKDGWTDLYVTSAGNLGNIGPGQHKLYRNNGNGSFTNVAAAAGVNFSHPLASDGWGICFGDYDADGDLDLFVTGFNGALGCKLYRNEGDGTFSDQTQPSEMFFTTPVGINAFAPRFADFDRDGDLDLFIAADFGTSQLVLNDGDGTFTNGTATAGVGLDENGMGGCMGDFDNDGWFDWYVTSIYLPAINWTGNKLYMNDGDGTFTETSGAAGVHDGGYGWSAVAADFDHDGDEDIAETNGGSSGGEFWMEQSYLWLNDGDGSSFTEAAVSSGLNFTGEGRGMMRLDYDNDGDQDLLIAPFFDVSRLFQNEITGTGTRWLRVFLDTMRNEQLPAHGYGAIVSVTVGGATRWRQMWGGDHFLGGSEMSAHFGLGPATVVDTLTVEWPNGEVTTLNNVPTNQTLTVEAPASAGWHTVAWGLGGTNGVPRLRGDGDLSDGSTVTIALTQARPSATAYFVFGLGEAPLPFYGGTLVPDLTPPGGFLVLGTDAQGELELSGPWPSGVPAGIELVLQYWMVDPAAPFGFAGSNAVKNVSS